MNNQKAYIIILLILINAAVYISHWFWSIPFGIWLIAEIVVKIEEQLTKKNEYE